MYALERAGDLDYPTPGRRGGMAALGTLLFHLGVLITYKYLDLFLGSLSTLTSALDSTWKPEPLGFVLPIGLSFICFKAISFITDVYWKQTSGRRSFAP